MSEDEKLYEELCKVLNETGCFHIFDVFDVIAVHDPTLPIVYQVPERLPYDIGYAMDRLSEKEIIQFDVHLQNGQKLMGTWFHLKNHRHGEIFRKKMGNQRYYDALFWSLKGIDENVKFHQFDTANNNFLGELRYSIALPQAIHIWKQALYYDELVRHFWNVPLAIMRYMANVRPISRDEYVRVRELAQATQPSFERLFPDPAPVYRRFRLSWLLHDWDEFWEAVNNDRQHFVNRKKRLYFYLNYEFK